MPAKTYKVDELLKAQPSSKVNADVVRRMHQSEAGIREHILRDVSNTSEPAYRRSRPRSSSIVTNPYEELPPDDQSFQPKPRNRSGRHSRYSPTPSIKRGAAEKLLKEHGSPPGIRVTAGGRIVPHGQSPVPSPRFLHKPYNKFQPLNRFNRGYGGNNNMNAGFKILNGMIIGSEDGTIYQYIDGQLWPIEQRAGRHDLYMPAPHLQYSHPASVYGPPVVSPVYTQFPPPVAPLAPVQDMNAAGKGQGVPHNPAAIARELRVMEQVHATLEQELKDLDRNEVLQRESLNATAKNEIVRRRVELVNRIDQNRRGIAEARRLMNDQPHSAAANMDAFVPQALEAFGALPPFRPTIALQPLYQTNAHTIPGATLEQSTYSPPPYQGPLQSFSQQLPSFDGHGAVPYQASQENMQSFHQAPVGEFANVTISALQERPGNAGMGQNSETRHETGGPADTVKGFYPSNLDGSAHQPRRSHAVEIKKPDESSGMTSTKSFLNPTSPSYTPSQIANSTNDDDRSVFMPSPTLIAQMDTLVQSPRRANLSPGHGDDGHHASDDSATTADFFPMNTKQYSSTKYSWSGHDARGNLPAWMSHNAADSNMNSHVSSSAIKTDWKYSGDSPEGLSNSSAINLDVRHPESIRPTTTMSPSHGNSSCDMDFITQSAFTHISPATKKQQSAHLRDSTATVVEKGSDAQADELDPVLNLLRKASQQASALSPETEHKPAFWNDLQHGMKHINLSDNMSEEYRQGFRDAMMQSSASLIAAGLVAPRQQGSPQHQNRPTMISHASPQEQRTWGSSLSRITTVPQFTLPGVPQNSVSSTPLTHRSLKERSPTVTATLDSPQMQADFMSQPNVNVNSKISPERSALPQPIPSTVRNNPQEPSSPLANRQPLKSMADLAAGRAFAAKVQNAKTPLDQQRFQKAKPSVAQTNEPAHAHIFGQLDGSEQVVDMHDTTKDKVPTLLPQSTGMNSPPISPITSPPMSPRIKTRSPVKSAATAAVASIAQLTRSGTKKEQESPTKSSSPEKRAWRAKWMSSKKPEEVDN